METLWIIDGTGRHQKINAKNISGADVTASTLCLALAIYFEARNQPIQGQLAVAYVVLNRVADKRWPDNVCDVVYQRKQFSFFSDGKSDRPTDRKAWRKARALAVVATLTVDATGGATHYHANYVAPSWGLCLRPVRVIGQHVFFRF